MRGGSSSCWVTAARPGGGRTLVAAGVAGPGALADGHWGQPRGNRSGSLASGSGCGGSARRRRAAGAFVAVTSARRRAAAVRHRCGRRPAPNDGHVAETRRDYKEAEGQRCATSDVAGRRWVRRRLPVGCGSGGERASEREPATSAPRLRRCSAMLCLVLLAASKA